MSLLPHDREIAERYASRISPVLSTDAWQAVLELVAGLENRMADEAKSRDATKTMEDLRFIQGVVEACTEILNLEGEIHRFYEATKQHPTRRNGQGLG